MTINIVEKYLNHHNLKFYKQADYTQVFMPFILMDCAYQIFANEFSRHIDEYRHEQKQCLRRIERSFWNYFTDFNKPFSEDELDIINADMDLFNDYHSAELMYMKVAFSNAFSELDLKEQMIITNMYLINTLAACAQTIWRTTFLTKKGLRGEVNTDIDCILVSSKRFGKFFGKRDKTIDEEQRIAIQNAQHAFIAKMRKFTINHQKIS